MPLKHSYKSHAAVEYIQRWGSTSGNFFVETKFLFLTNSYLTHFLFLIDPKRKYWRPLLPSCCLNLAKAQELCPSSTCLAKPPPSQSFIPSTPFLSRLSHLSRTCSKAVLIWRMSSLMPYSIQWMTCWAIGSSKNSWRQQRTHLPQRHRPLTANWLNRKY